MKLLFLDCSMGAAGDMLSAALLELFENREEILYELNQLGIPHVRFVSEDCVKCGIRGTRMRVLVDDAEEDETMHEHRHTHSGLQDIAHILQHSRLCDRLFSDVMAVYRRIAEAESLVHGVPVEQIHFHEVGALDAVADIAAVCYLMDKLQPQAVHASPVHVGSGQVRCAHGLLPVPAPATAELLKGVPIYGGEIRGELCTPTGAALLMHFVTQFGKMPAMTVSAIGYGMGKKDFPAANCVRAMLGEAAESAENIVQLCCNLDDMTGEEIGFATERLFEGGALDVFTTAIGMKKGRPGVLLTVLCAQDKREALVRLMFRHTTTLGIRQTDCARYTLTRSSETVHTPYGDVRRKNAAGYGVKRSKYEYEDLAQIARAHDLDIRWLKDE